jgi:dTDP-4-amino-4,6-dideoxygalactose transaminase
MKSEKLAIHGGLPAVTDTIKRSLKPWPQPSPRTAERLKQLYLSGKWSFNGAYEQEFSRKFADYCGARHGVFMVNGTVTLESALHALGVKAGDEVIVPGNTWIATAMAAVYLGAKPVFVDVEPDTLCLDPEQVRLAITRRTKAIIPVHLFGSMADMDRLMKISRETDIPLVEDCAHAHGGFWNGKGLGTIGRIGSFSFQQSKTLSSGEGGICLTQDDELADKLFRIKHIGYGAGQKQGEAATGPAAGLVCHNYRGLEFNALILTEALKLLKAQTAQRDANALVFADLIKDVPGITVQARGRRADVQGYYNFVMLLDPQALQKGYSIKEIREALAAEGMPCGRGYGPVYRHLLWNLPASAYRIHSRAVVEDSTDNRMLTLMHSWLLAGRPMMKAMARAVTKVMKTYAK